MRDFLEPALEMGLVSFVRRGQCSGVPEAALSLAPNERVIRNPTTLVHGAVVPLEQAGGYRVRLLF